jgi:hypothetical protein
MTSRKNNASRTLSFQQLESRQLMAVKVLPGVALTPVVAPPQVSAVLSKGVLTITGDGKSDAITIVQPSLNEFVLASTNGTLFNGNHTSLDFTGVTGNVNITLKGGTKNTPTTESLTLGTGSPITFDANLNVSMGNGNNYFYMTNAVVNRKMTLNGGLACDFASISNTTIGTAPGRMNKAETNDLAINLSGGTNSLYIQNNVNVQRDLTISDGLSASDSITIRDGVTVGRNLTLTTGNGADFVDMAGVKVQGNLHIDTGYGNDALYLGGFENDGIAPVYADEVYVNLGAGNDYMQLGASYAGGVYGITRTSFGDYIGGAGNDTWANDSGTGLDGSISGFEVNE